MFVGLQSYKFGRKNNWRRANWNFFAQSPKPRKQLCGLILTGEEALDLPVAMSKGFDSRNIFICEQDKRVATVLRSRHKLNVIRGNLADVIYSWPDHTPLDFVLADLCSPYGHESSRLALAILLSKGKSHAFRIMINLQRGREQACCSWVREAREYLGGVPHRGELWYAKFLTLADKYFELPDSLPGSPWIGRDYTSYRSKQVTMDGCRMIYFPHRLGNLKTNSAEASKWFHDIRSSISAALAIRTVRRSA